METKDYIKNIEGAERRYFSSEVRAAKMEDTAEDVGTTIEGYAAKFNSATEIGYYYKFKENILPGAFDDVLNDDVRCLFNHNPDYVLARSDKGKGTLTLTVDEVGLKYSYVTPDRQFAKDLADMISVGDISQSSFAFEIQEETWTEIDGQMATRDIVKFKKLYDVSPVTYPAYVDTEVAARSLTAFKEKNNPEQRSENKKELNAFDAQLIINSNL
jgi:HK97 family phage prohead protease